MKILLRIEVVEGLVGKGGVWIRLVCIGRKKFFYYCIIIVNSCFCCDGKFLEMVGYYNFMLGMIFLNVVEIEFLRML